MEDLDGLIKSELFPSVEGIGSSSSAANVVHSKPQRPGRGKTKAAKFTIDD